MTKVEQGIALAVELVEARANVARIEAELGALFGEGAPKKPRQKREPRESLRLEIVKAKPLPPGPLPTPSPTTAKRGQRLAQVVELALQGLGGNAIAEKLGISNSLASVTLTNARKKGLLPKVERRKG